MKMQLDPIILDLSKSAMPQETCKGRQSLSHKNMGLLVLLVLALFLIPSKIMIWPTIVFPILLTSNSPPMVQKIIKRHKK